MSDLSDYSAEYAECYELITQHKSYAKEVDSLSLFLETYGVSNILSIGCGIGSHELYLAEKGFNVFGIDKSQWMINYARLRSKGHPRLSFGTTYKNCDQHFSLPCECLISLFNVINCLPDLLSLRNFFDEAIQKLSPGGIFLFEAWNGIECMINPPEVVIRNFTSPDGSHLNRKALPELNLPLQKLQIEYEIWGRMRGRLVKIKSVHDIRLFTINEIMYLLSSVGFKSLQVYSSLPDLEPFDFNSANPPRMLTFTASV